MYNFIFNNLIWSEGKNIIIINILLFIVFLKINYYFSLIFLLILIFCFFFFRNPRRILEKISKEDIVSPADGHVLEIVTADQPLFDNFYKKISIFLSPLDAHVNWIPIGGKILEINYKVGKFTLAFLPKSSELNECNDILIDTEFKQKILVRQIAGTLARRIVCWIKHEDYVISGQKYGMIKFSSRVDIFFEKNVEIKVKLNQKVYGGQTIIAKVNYDN